MGAGGGVRGEVGCFVFVFVFLEMSSRWTGFCSILRKKAMIIWCVARKQILYFDQIPKIGFAFSVFVQLIN